MGCYALLQGIYSTQGLNPTLILSPALAGEFFTTGATWEALSLYLRDTKIWDKPHTSQTCGMNLLGCQEARDRAKGHETLGFLKLAQDHLGHRHTELLGKEIKHIFCMKVSLVKSI